MISAGIFSSVMSLLVVFTAVLDMIFLGRKQYKHHWTGIVLIVLGVSIVGFVDVAKKGTDTGNELFGIILLLIAKLFNAM